MVKNDNAEPKKTHSSGVRDGSPSSSGTPFALKKMFPDAKGVLEVEYASLAEIKADCLVFLDASALLLPYSMAAITLRKVLDVYKPLAEQERLIVPAQAAREFARNRSKKVGDIVQHLRGQSSHLGPPIKGHMGLLVDDNDFQELQKLSDKVADLAKEIQKKVGTIVDNISGEVGGDPVSVGYRDALKGCVRDNDEHIDEDAFKKDMEARYAIRQPPGYADRKKTDGGAGDLLIWNAVLNAGEADKRHCIFVTADTKFDWYTQSAGAFQPRLELIEEYRARSSGRTVHIIPLSRLLQLFEADSDAVSDTRDAELTLSTTIDQSFHTALLEKDSEWSNLADKKVQLQAHIQALQERINAIAPDDVNTSLSLPWNRAVHSMRIELGESLSKIDDIDERLLNLSLES